MAACNRALNYAYSIRTKKKLQIELRTIETLTVTGVHYNYLTTIISADVSSLNVPVRRILLPRHHHPQIMYGANLLAVVCVWGRVVVV